MFETKNAIANGSSEIDMVINIGFLKDGRYEEVEEEIKACEIVTNAGAEFIKPFRNKPFDQDHEKYRQWCRILISENEELKNEYSIND